MLLGGAAIVLIAIAIVGFVALSSDNEPGDSTADTSLIESGGTIIGDPNAPVTLVEFGDFQ